MKRKTVTITIDRDLLTNPAVFVIKLLGKTLFFPLYWFATALTYLSPWKIVITTGLGLTIGFLVSATFFSSPFMTWADPGSAKHSGITPLAISVNGVPLTDFTEHTLSQGLGVGAQVVVSTRKKQNVQLDQKIEVMGDNNGIYTYRITAIREVPPEQVAQIVEQTSTGFVLISPSTTFLSTTRQITMAK